MKKNIFDDGAKQEIIDRSRSITEHSKRKWGSMTAAEMLRHCSAALTATMAGYHSGLPDTFRQKLLKYLFLNFIPKYPKGAKTPRQLDVKINNTTTHGLQNEQQHFEEQLNLFVGHANRISATHPYFGNLTSNQWGIITWMHLDHHLRQFGV